MLNCIPIKPAMSCGCALALTLAGAAGLAWCPPDQQDEPAADEQELLPQPTIDITPSQQDATTDDVQDPEPSELQEIDGLTYDLLQQARDEYTITRRIDVNDDGTPDFVIEVKPDSGPLSTYFSVYRIRALGENRILRGGAPLKPGDQIALADLLTGKTSTPMFSVGGSLRYPDRDGSDFSSGAWYKVKHGSLAVAIRGATRIGLGSIRMSAARNGHIEIHDISLTWLPEVAHTIAPIE